MAAEISGEDGKELIEALGKALAIKPNRVGDLLTMARFLESVDRRKANEYFRRAVAASNRSCDSRLCQSLNRSRYDLEAAHIQEAYEVACEIVSRFPLKGFLSEADTPRDLFLRCIDYERFDALPDMQALMRHWVGEGRIEPFWTVFGRVKTPEDRLDLVKYHRAWGRRWRRRWPRRPLNIHFLQ